MQNEIIPTNRKALKVNIDSPFYGSFAEIGGGQETARHFFQAGGASGTIAKSISAYDKSFSDLQYNKNKQGRYVSEERLLKMLDKEYLEVDDLLSDKKPDALFFAFANTFEILNYDKSNYAHGWIGIKFQLKADEEPNTVIAHVKLLENDGLLQQSTMGVLGVNLIYACCNFYDHPNSFIRSLTDNLSTDRFRITMMRMSGPQLDYVDNRLLGVQLVKNGMTRAIMFDKNGDVQMPMDMLYKKNVLAFRGNFNPITYIAKDILNSSIQLFKKDEDYLKDNTLFFCELTLNNLLLEGGQVDERDFLNRVDMLNSIGQNVMVSDIGEYYQLVDFFTQYNIKKLRIVMGVPSLKRILEEKYYSNLMGGILEAFGKLFPQNIKLYIYPTMNEGSKEIQTSKNITPGNNLKSLYSHLIENNFILDLNSNMKAQLHIKARQVLQMIKNGNKEWEKYVPMNVARMIKEKGLYE
jgi:hypothetical protein